MIAEIPLTRGLVAVVDAEDLNWLSAWKWYADSKGYASRSVRAGGRRKISLHREVVHAPTGMQVDHVNHDPLDCRKSNLRLCSPRQNMQNRRTEPGAVRFRGVWKDNRSGKFRAAIRLTCGRVGLGLFEDAESAAAAYDKAAAVHHGEFAILNFVRGGPMAGGLRGAMGAARRGADGLGDGEA